MIPNPQGCASGRLSLSRPKRQRLAGAWLVLGAMLTALPGTPAFAQAACQVRLAPLQGSYAGECIAGLASGRGRAQGVDRYEGQWRAGLPTGQGVYTFADGRRFEGEFLDGRVQGRARFHYGNGDVLEGEFRDDRLVGVGRMTRASGAALLVQLQDGRMVALGPAPLAAAPGTAPPVAPPAPAAVPPAAPAVAPALTPVGPGPGGDASPAGLARLEWSGRLDMEDLFPSFILATATRPQPAPPSGSRSAGSPRGETLAIDPVEFLRGPSPGADGGRARLALANTDAQYLGDAWGLVGVRVRNTRPGAVVTLRVSIDEVAEPTEASFTLPTAGVYALYPRIRYRYERLRNVLQPFPVNVTWELRIDGQSAGMQNAVARVRSVQDAPHAVVTPRGVERLLWVFSGYVTEDAAWLDELIKEAFAGAASGALGYQADAAGVDRQVAAVYDMLKRRGVKYSSITTTSSTAQRVGSQIVRFPSDSIRTAQANCVDGTVLMASLLRKMGIEPIIVTGPGHALLGYFRRPPPSKQGEKPDFAFVETTMIGGAPFAAAVQSGNKTVNEWADKHGEDPRFQVLPVFVARNAGITPIAR